MPLLLLVLTVYLLIRLQAFFYKHRCFHGVESSVAFQDASVTEGDQAFLTETIANRKLLPLITLQVNFRSHKALQFLEKENSVSTDYTYRNDIFSVMPYEKVTRTLPFLCTRRGYYHIDDFYLIAHDLFMTEKYIQESSFDTHLYVYPRSADPKRLHLPLQKTVGNILTKRYSTEDPFEFRGIREYQIYDPMKTINWKASAKGGGLKVNTHNYTSDYNVTLILDMETDPMWQQNALMEESIRIVSAYAEGLIRQGIPVRIISNGCDQLTETAFTVENGVSRQHIETIKEGLARIDIHQKTDSIIPFLKKEEAYSSGKNVYVFVSRLQNQPTIDAYEGLCAEIHGCQWIVPLHYDMPCPALCSTNIDVIKWEVPYGQD